MAHGWQLFLLPGGARAVFLGALERCIHLYKKEPEKFRALQQRDMEQDFSWNVPAERYMDLFGSSNRYQFSDDKMVETDSSATVSA